MKMRTARETAGGIDPPIEVDHERDLRVAHRVTLDNLAIVNGRLFEHEQAIENIRLSAAGALSYGHQATPLSPKRMIERKEEYLRNILKFCADVGSIGTILRSGKPTP
jgi:hypothetical protein